MKPEACGTHHLPHTVVPSSSTSKAEGDSGGSDCGSRSRSLRQNTKARIFSTRSKEEEGIQRGRQWQSSSQTEIRILAALVTSLSLILPIFCSLLHCCFEIQCSRVGWISSREAGFLPEYVLVLPCSTLYFKVFQNINVMRKGKGINVG